MANGYDHADGFLGGAAFAGLALARAPLAGALVPFLCANLARPARGAAPHAYLGDSGSHLLGILLLATPAGQAALVLPALDYARVLVLRARAGEPLWRGDRRHLGQRLGDAGRGPLAAAGLALAAAAPALAAGFAAELGWLPWPASLGVGACGSALALGLLLRAHPAR